MSTITLNNTSALTTSLQEILLADDIVPGSEPSYQACKTLYLYHPLGQKMAESPIAMAQFLPRDIAVPDSPEEDVVKAFNDEWKAINAERYIFNTAKLARIYGVASLVCLSESVKPNLPLDFKSVSEATISFNVYDPLNTAGSLVLNQNPNDLDFLKSTTIAVQGQSIHRSRTVVMMNEDPIYLGYTNSAFGYVGRSIYQRPLFALKSFIQTMLTDDLVSNKAGVIIASIEQPGSIIDNMMTKLFGLKREFVKAAANYGVISIGPKDKIESLNLTNIDGASANARKNILENIAVAADMPAKLLNAETFAEGFGEGTEDAKNVARYIDRVRTWMQPLYDFFDKIVMFRAWNEEFYKIIQAKYPGEYASVDYATAFYKWRNSFHASWPSLLTEPDSERAKADDVKLKAIIALAEILLPECDPENKARVIEWVADNFNALKTLFDSPLELNYEDLATYEPPEQQALQEPKPGHPFAAQDSSATLKRLIRERRAMREATSDADKAANALLRAAAMTKQLAKSKELN